MHSDEKLTETFKALSHPLRQDIIFIIAERNTDGIGFTALQHELNQTNKGKKIQVGTIYHHVKLLGGLLDQTKSSKWILSEKGWFAYNLLTSSKDRNQFLKQEDQKESKLNIISRIVAPPELFFYVKRAPLPFFGWQIIFFLIFSVIAADSNLVLFLVFFGELSEPNYLLTLISIIVSWCIFSLITVTLSKQLLKRKSIYFKDVLTVSIFLGLSLLPLVLFPLFVSFSLISLDQQFTPLVVVVLLQLWVILLATRGISVQFLIRMERAGIIALIAVYIMMILGLILEF